MRIMRPSISSMTASVIGFDRSSSARSRQAANQRSTHVEEPMWVRGEADPRAAIDVKHRLLLRKSLEKKVSPSKKRRAPIIERPELQGRAPAQERRRRRAST